MPLPKRICVYCGSSTGNDPRFAAAAVELARALVRRKIGLVYGGGNVGLMGILADEVLKEGGEVVGVIPRALVARELAHPGCTELHETDSMHARKQRFHELSDGFVALPGGLGTFEELLETLTWSQLGIHENPVGILNVAGYYDALLALFTRAAADGLLKKQHAALLLVDDRVDGLLDRMARYRAPGLKKWVTKDEG